MIPLRDKATGTLIGDMSEDQLQFLIDQLEEQDTEDRAYAIAPRLLQSFELEGADLELVSMLTEALGPRESMEVVWSREI